MEYFQCYRNQFTDFDISQNTDLILLNCWANDLTSLDVTNNPLLTSIVCFQNELSSLDVTQNSELTLIAVNTNFLTGLDVSQNTKLERLDCGLNQIVSLDLSQNPELYSLGSGGNLISSLDFSQNTELESVFVQDNNLSSLDLSQNTNLLRLFCAGNQLIELNLKNGTNTNIVRMFAYDNPDLECIQVDDVGYSNTQICDQSGNMGWCKDASALYSENCMLGLNEDTKTVFSFFPNPVNDELHISAEGQIESVEIYSMQGNLVAKYAYGSMNVSALTSGIYLLNVKVDGRTSFQNFVKK